MRRTISFSIIFLLSLNFQSAFAQESADGSSSPTDPGAISTATGGIKDWFGSMTGCIVDKASAPSTSSQEKIKSAGRQVQTAYDNFAAEQGCTVPEYTRFQKALNTYNTAAQKCADAQRSAKTNCLENCSPDIKNIVSGASVLMGALSGSSVVNACSTMGKVMDIMQGGLTAFGGNCGVRKTLCDSSCSSAVAALNDLKTIQLVANYCPTPAQLAAVNANLKTSYQPLVSSVEADLAATSGSDEITTASRKSSCTGYATQLGGAAVGVLSAILAAKQANNCDKASNGTVAQTAFCDNPANVNTDTCICKRAPRTPGCALAATSANQNSSGGFGSFSDSTAPTSAGALSLPSAALNADKSPGAGSSGSGSSAGGASGGAGIPGGGGGGSGDVGANKDPGVIKKLNTNIFGGEGGGGGGGGSSRGTASVKENELRGKIAAEHEAALLRSQVSSPGGRTNWEKVQERYTTEKTSLMGP